MEGSGVVSADCVVHIGVLKAIHAVVDWHCLACRTVGCPLGSKFQISNDAHCYMTSPAIYACSACMCCTCTRYRPHLMEMVSNSNSSASDNNDEPLLKKLGVLSVYLRMHQNAPQNTKNFLGGACPPTRCRAAMFSTQVNKSTPHIKNVMYGPVQHVGV